MSEGYADTLCSEATAGLNAEFQHLPLALFRSLGVNGSGSGSA